MFPACHRKGQTVTHKYFIILIIVDIQAQIIGIQLNRIYPVIVRGIFAEYDRFVRRSLLPQYGIL